MRTRLLLWSVICGVLGTFIPQDSFGQTSVRTIESFDVSGWTAYAVVRYPRGSDLTYVTCHIEREFGRVKLELTVNTSFFSVRPSIVFSNPFWNFDLGLHDDLIMFSIDDRAIADVILIARGSAITMSGGKDLEILVEIANGQVLRLAWRDLRLTIPLGGTYDAIGWLWGCHGRYPVPEEVQRHLVEISPYRDLVIDLLPGWDGQAPDETREHASPQTPEPIGREGRELALTGSGVVINHLGHIVTNYHVIADCRQVRIPGIGVAQLVAENPDDDLALLRVSGAPPATAAFSSDGVRPGDAVVVMGYPLTGLLAREMNVTTGNVSAAAGPGGDSRLIQITAPVQPGNSGGPVIDASGHLVGIVVARLDGLEMARQIGVMPQNVNFAIKASVVRDFLETSGTPFETAIFGWRRDTAEIADEARDYTMLLECWK